MKKYLVFYLAALLIACNDPSSQSEMATTDKPDAAPEFYKGSWALDLDFENSAAGWLDVRQEEDYLDADIMWRAGSVNPVEFVFFSDGQLIVTRGRDIVRERNAEGEAVRTHHAISFLKLVKSGEDKIKGTGYFPASNGLEMKKVSFSGKRIPEPEKRPDLSSITYGESRSLINDNSLDGWKLLEENAANGWSVEGGILKNNPEHKQGEQVHYGNLRTEDTYSDFRLTLEVKIPEGSNSGVYLRGIYEVQVADTYGKEPDNHNMGALYSRITPSVSAEKPAGEWQELDITLYKRHLTVILNGIPIIENQPVRGITGGAMTADEFSPGPIYLQGDHGTVAYRNIELTPIKE